MAVDRKYKCDLERLDSTKYLIMMWTYMNVWFVKDILRNTYWSRTMC